MEILEHTHTMGHGVRPSESDDYVVLRMVLGLWPRGLPTFINLAAWEKREPGGWAFPPHIPLEVVHVQAAAVEGGERHQV